MILPLLIGALALQEPVAPRDFVVEKAAESTFPMFAAFDDRGRLYVTESSGEDLYVELQKLVRRCKVRRFEDKDGDGKFETSTVFAENLTPSMGLAWHQGRLYVADPPDLAVLEDLDDDGKADRRRVILTGFGHTDNGSLHGIAVGPDGLLYMTTGTPDGYSIPGRGGRTLKGVSGALIRCKPDGSDAEVVARGFENLIEVVFLPGGDILGTCNWYQKPVGGIRDAIIHLVDGGLYPYAPDKGTAYPVTGRLLPPVELFPAVALSGLSRCETATFPEEMRGNLFSAQHNTRKVTRHVLQRSGSTWTSKSVDFVSSENPDFHPSDVLEAPDGSLIVVDTGAWYVQHCPTGKIRNSRAPGGIYRVRYAGPKPGGRRAEPARIPVGLSVELLQKWLPDPAASRALARLAKPEAAPALVEVLKAGTPPQKLGAAEGLAACGTPQSIAAIWEALQSDPDPILEHALIHALLGIAKGKPLSDPKTWPEHPRVERAMLLVLDQVEPGLRPDQILRHLRSRDLDLRSAALSILKRHPEWSAAAAGAAEGWLTQPALSDQDRESLIGVLLAFQGDPKLQEQIAAALKKDGGSTRVALLEAMGEMTLPTFPAAWKEGVARALADPRPDLRLQAVRTVATLGLKDFDERLAELAGRAEESVPLRLEALRARVVRHPKLPSAASDFLLGGLATGGEAVTRLAAAEILRRAALSDDELSRALKAIRGDALVSPSLFAPLLAKAGAAPVAEAAESIRAGWRPSKAELGPLLEKLPGDVRELLEKSSEDQVRRLAAFEPLLKGGDPAKGREVFFDRKVACGTCHSVGAQGGRVGPDLTKIGAIRAGRDLLESILVPSSTFAQNYESYLVLTQDGGVLTGLLARQSSDTVVLRDAGGAELQLRRDRIQQMKRAEKSIMPENLERAMSEREFRDLLAFLQSLR